MEFKWIITDEDTKLIREFVNKQKEHDIVKNRIKVSLLDNPQSFSKEEFWKQMVICLLTTQQKSGKDKPVDKFSKTNPFPLNYNLCKGSKNIQEDAYNILSIFKGIRRTNRISEEIKFNLNWLEDGGWEKIEEIYEKLLEERKQQSKLENIKIERTSCLFVQNLKGIGPKQSRNLWQTLELTRYEIPIDSRVTKWLNKNKFPFTLSATALSDENYYQLVMDGIQKLCLQSDILPYILDGAIFSSYEKE